tara:strand:- start:532 stop:678 length:147 start_codon:yes stop_codon:yes gene_type:complete
MIIVKKAVFVSKTLSKVPKVLAKRISLLKTFKEENIKSIETRLKKAFK